MKYMLDTNTVSYFLKQHPGVTKRITELPLDSLCLSVISEGELRYGLARKPEAKNLHKVVQEFLKRIDVLTWNGDAAQHYGNLRAELEAKGDSLGSLDMLIAAHAFSMGATLVTNDKAFTRVKKLKVEDWT
jgi:tRNA(fMet)-specific endonuclease VapC